MHNYNGCKKNCLCFVLFLPMLMWPDLLRNLMFFKWADPSDTYKGFACLPYISGLTEPLTRLLRKNKIRVVNKPFKTLQHKINMSYPGYSSIFYKILYSFVGGAVASWLVRSSPDRAVRVRALAGDTVLCSWARHFTLTVPLFTQLKKWVLTKFIAGGYPAMD